MPDEIWVSSNIKYLPVDINVNTNVLSASLN